MTTTDPTYAALLAGVLAATEDDVPRLVLADWLEENAQCLRCWGRGWYDREPGDGEMSCMDCNGAGLVRGRREWAEFIRVQVELASRVWNCPGCSPHSMYCFEGCDDCDTHSALRRREEELLRSDWYAWLGDLTHDGAICLNLEPFGEGRTLRTPRGWTGFEFRRGFAESVTCDLETFMGGPCENCGGFGEFRRRHDNGDGPEGPCPDCGGRWNSGPHDYLDDYWDRGTGRTPGIAPRLFASQPVLTVALVDAINPREYGGGDDRWAVYRDELGPLWGILCRDAPPQCEFAERSDRQEIEAALSVAAVAYGRANAEGHSYEAVCDRPGCNCNGTSRITKPGLPPLAVPTSNDPTPAEV